MENNSVLVTGGAGYIGSHVVRQLGESGEHIVTLDNLSTGFEEAILYGDFIKGDTGDDALVSQIIREYNVKTVMHFAAHTIVPESVSNPLKYYWNNTSSTRNLLEQCQQNGVEHFIFSSTAAVYGLPDTGIAIEAGTLAPINPYGTSKLMSEWMLRDVAAASNMRFIALRYFNVAGCDPLTRIGQSTAKATLLVKVACEAALGKRQSISIFGTDYPTPDGTGIRDYIHVEDLADAHLKSLSHLRHGGESNIFNVGYGHGYSVREVLDMVEKVNGSTLPITEEPRREGDPPSLIANCNKIKQHLGWKPKFDDLECIVQSSLNWERKLQSVSQ